MCNIFNKLKEIKKPIVIYGAGGQAQRLYKVLSDKEIPILCFCVSKDVKAEQHIGDVPIYNYLKLKEVCNCYHLLIAVTAEKLHEITSFLQDNNEVNSYTHMCMPYKVDNNFLNADDYSKIQNENIRDLFADEASKLIFDKTLYAKMTGDMSALIDNIKNSGFFDPTLLDKEMPYTYIDCGAYTGDTIMQFCQFNGNNYNKIIGIEMEKGNFTDLQTFVKFAALRDVQTINAGLWSEDTLLEMHTSDKEHFMQANLFTDYSNVSSVKEQVLLNESNPMKTLQIHSTTIDKLLCNERIEHGILKINAMGADLEILRGAMNFLLRCSPTVLLEYGNSNNHIIELPKFLDSLHCSYKLYLRQHLINQSIKTILHAVVRK